MDIVERLTGYIAYNTKQSREEDDVMRDAVIEIKRLRDVLEWTENNCTGQCKGVVAKALLPTT